MGTLRRIADSFPPSLLPPPPSLPSSLPLPPSSFALCPSPSDPAHGSTTPSLLSPLQSSAAAGGSSAQLCAPAPHRGRGRPHSFLPSFPPFLPAAGEAPCPHGPAAPASLPPRSELGGPAGSAAATPLESAGRRFPRRSAWRLLLGGAQPPA